MITLNWITTQVNPQTIEYFDGILNVIEYTDKIEYLAI